MDSCRVVITHPRSSNRLPAELTDWCTPAQLLAGLQIPTATPNGPFLAPAQSGQPYVLVNARTNEQLPTDEPILDADVLPGDVLEVQQMAQGAQSSC